MVHVRQPGVILLALAVSTFLLCAPHRASAAETWMVLEMQSVAVPATLGTTISDLVRANIDNVERCIQRARQEHDLPVSQVVNVVLPEYSLLNDDWFNPSVGIPGRSKLTGWFKSAANFLAVQMSRVDRAHYEARKFECDEEAKAEGGSGATALHNLPCLAIAQNVNLFANLLTKHAESRLKLANTLFMFEASSGFVRSAYDKRHLIHAEDPILYPGTNDPTVVQLRASGPEVGLLICFDILFGDMRMPAVHQYVWSNEWRGANTLYSMAVAQGFSRATQSYVFAATMNSGPGSHARGTGSGVFAAGRSLEHFSGLVSQETMCHAMVVEVKDSKQPPKYFKGDRIPAKHPADVPVTPDVKARFNNRYVSMTHDSVDKEGETVAMGDEGSERSHVLDVAGLKCRFEWKVTKKVAGDRYVMQVMHGNLHGRLVRACAFFIACAECAGHRQWNNMDVEPVTEFEYVRVTGAKLRGGNVAVLPLQLTVDTDKTPAPVAAKEGIWRQAGRTDGTQVLVLKPVTKFVLANSLYGVYGEVPPPPKDMVDQAEGDGGAHSGDRRLQRSASDSDLLGGALALLREEEGKEHDEEKDSTDLPSDSEDEEDTGAGVGKGKSMLAKKPLTEDDEKDEERDGRSDTSSTTPPPPPTGSASTGTTSSATHLAKSQSTGSIVGRLQEEDV